MYPSKLINEYAHDYRYTPMMEDDIRTMLIKYTEEYEASKDDAGVGDTFEHPHKEKIAWGITLAGMFFVFAVGIYVCLWFLRLQ